MGDLFLVFNLEHICTGEITRLYLVLTRDVAARF